LIYNALALSPELVVAAAAELPVVRIVEAITNMSAEDLAAAREAVFSVLRVICDERMNGLTGIEKTFFRKGVAFVDEQLFAT
jgi:hypothetical protein